MRLHEVHLLFFAILTANLGKNGADIRCNSDSISVSISTSKPFHGHLFIEGRFNDKRCMVRSNTSDVTLNVGLLECGIKRQFSVRFLSGIPSRTPRPSYERGSRKILCGRDLDK